MDLLKSKFPDSRQTHRFVFAGSRVYSETVVVPSVEVWTCVMASRAIDVYDERFARLNAHGLMHIWRFERRGLQADTLK